jgi:hypothetical protein
MRVIEDALGSASGYVADLTNASFGALFRRDIGVEIGSEKYSYLGTSKGKRLRAFLEVSDDPTALAALKALKDYVQAAGWTIDRSDWQTVWSRFEDLIVALAEPREAAIEPADRPVWLAAMHEKLREIQRVAFRAYDDAADQGTKAPPEGTQIVLETHYKALSALLPADFPPSAAGDLGRHIKFCELSDMRSIVGWDVPDIMAAADRYVTQAAALDPARDDEEEHGEILSLVDELFHRPVALALTADEPNWHMLVLECCLLLGRRFTGKTGLPDDLSSYGRAFNLTAPLLLVPEDLSTDNNRNWQQGAMFLFQGYRAFLRNTHAHDISDGDRTFALQAIMFLSILAEVLSSSRRADAPPSSPPQDGETR